MPWGPGSFREHRLPCQNSFTSDRATITVPIMPSSWLSSRPATEKTLIDYNGNLLTSGGFPAAYHVCN